MADPISSASRAVSSGTPWGAIATGAGALIDGLSNIGAVRRAKKIAKYQFDLQKEMWELQNEYNSPASQRKRLEEAGYNPNLLFGQGPGVSTGNSTDYPKPQQPGHQAPYLGVGQRISDAANLALSVINSAQQRRESASRERLNDLGLLPKYQAEAETSKLLGNLHLSKTFGENLSNDLKRIQLRYQDTLYQKEIALNDADIEIKGQDILESAARTNLMWQQSSTESQRRKLMRSTMALQSSQMIVNAALDWMYSTQGELNFSNTSLARYNQSKVLAETRLITQKVQNLVLEGKYTEALTALTDYKRTDFLPSQLHQGWVRTINGVYDSVKDFFELNTDGELYEEKTPDGKHRSGRKTVSRKVPKIFKLKPMR